MCQLREYIKEVLGTDVQVENLTKQYLADLPLYISEVYLIHKLVLFDRHLIVVKPKDLDSIRIRVVSKHIEMLRKYFGNPVVDRKSVV